MIGEALDRAVLEGKLVAGDGQWLGDHCAEIAGLGDEGLIGSAVSVLMRHQRWGDAGDLLRGLDAEELSYALKLRLCDNLACLSRYRPDVYKRVIVNQGSTRFQIVSGADGHLTIVDSRGVGDGGAPRVMAKGGNPILCMRECFEGLKETIESGNTYAMYGIGDGYLLKLISQKRPDLFMHMSQAVHLMELNPDLIRSCMMIHDYTDECGPIRDGRFFWHVGQTWAMQFKRVLCERTLLMFPVASVSLSYDAGEMRKKSDELAGWRVEEDARRKADLEVYYGGISHGDWVEIYSGSPRRKPRVLITTSIFTTVLQYAARDVGDAFEKIGWDVLILKEGDACERTSLYGWRCAAHVFKPDMVFMFDHLRSETRDFFPEPLPVVTWAQDHLSNLTNKGAGGEMGLRDYFLTFAKPMFVNEFDYPERQCIAFPMMLTRDDVGADGGDEVGDAKGHGADGLGLGEEGEGLVIEGGEETLFDLVYVSNVSGVPEMIFEDQLKDLYEPGLVRSVVEACCERMIGIYREGGCLEDSKSLGELFDGVCLSKGLSCHRMDLRADIIAKLNNPLNITLYRQQALGWVADAAEALGLSLGLYGRGWEDHPRFGKYGRGVVEHGEALSRLTRGAKINFCLEPYACFTHHRLLDGLMAGGFYLVRDHRSGRVMQELSDFLSEHGL